MNLSKILFFLLLFAGQLFAQNPPATFQYDVTDGTTTYTVDFALHSARGPNYEVQVQQADGSFLAHTPAASRTYIGTIASLPGAMVSGLRRSDGSTYYHVLFEDGSEWINNGSGTSVRTSQWTARWPSYVVGSGGSGSEVWAAEIGVDLPNSQYTIAGSSDAALEMIDHSVNTTNLLYLRDANIINQLGRVVLRADAALDPYAGLTSVNNMYPLHQNEWRVVLPGVLPASDHNMSMVVSSAAGSGGGVAGGGVGSGIAGTAALSANGSTAEGDFSIVWRHEVGHNWSLGHFDGNTPEGATINSGNALSRMSGPEQAKVLAHRTDRASYLDNLGAYPVAIPPRASLDRVTYELATSQVVIDVLDNDSDANGDSLSISSFQTVGSQGGSITLSSGTGPDGRDQLIYIPQSSFLSEPDHFTYVIADATGRTATGNVIIRSIIASDVEMHYTLDDAAGESALDSSSYAQNGSVSGTATWGTGAIGGALILDGVDDYIKGADLTGSTDTITLTAWVKRDGDQDRFDGIAFNRGVGSSLGLNMGSDNQLGYHWNNSFWGWHSGLVIPDNTWTFVALVVSPTEATLYMDDGTGMQSATNAGAHAVEDLDGVLNLGQDPLGNRRFKGGIDDVRFYTRNFSPAEINELAAGHGSVSTPSPQHQSEFYASQVGLSWTSMPSSTSHRVYFSTNYTDVRDGLAGADLGTTTSSNFVSPVLAEGQYFWRVDSYNGTSWVTGSVWMFTIKAEEKLAHWKFDEGSGTTAADSSTNSYDAPLAGDTAWASGVSGGGVLLDGDGDYLQGPTLNQSLRSLTITGWLKRNGDQAPYAGIVYTRGSQGTGLQFGPENNELRYNWSDQNHWVASNLVVPDGVWTFVALTVNEGAVTMYMNAGSGMQSSFSSINGNYIEKTFDTPLYIGRDPVAAQYGIRDFKGSMDDMRIYSRALSAEEILVVSGVPNVSADSFSISENVVSGTSVGNVVASDPNNDPLTYAITSGNTGGAFAIEANTGAITIAAGIDFETANQYVLSVTASDLSGLVGAATVTVDVTNVNEAPTANDNSGNIAENTAAGAAIATVTSSDPDAGDSATYSITGGNAGGDFAINAASGVITTTAALNYEAANSHTLTITATDAGGLTDTATVTVTVSDINEAPTANDNSGSIAENTAAGAAIATVTSSDPDAGDSVTYSITGGNAGGEFAINAASGAITTTALLDFEAASSYVLTVTAADSGSLTDTATVNVNVTNVNEAPTATNNSGSVAENTVAGAVIATIGASDPDAGDSLNYTITSGNTGGAFAIDANTGVITTASVLDYEILNSYALIVIATDMGGLTGTASVAVTVTNVTTGDDSDSDSMDDDWEVTHFGGTTSQTGSGDADNDGLNNAGEFAANTNPNSVDTDADGFSDKFEVDQSSDPNSNASTPDTLLAAFWDFDNSAVSSESKDRVGAIQGSIVSGAAYTSDAGGRSAQPGDLGMDFGTTTAGQRVDVASAAFLNTAAGDDKLTISYWQKLTSTGFTSSSFWAVSPSSPSEERGIQAHTPWSNNRIYFDMGGAGAGSRIEVGGSSVTWTDWNHIALVKNGGTAEIWVNGVKLHTLSGMSALKTDISRLVIGATGTGGNSLRGVIDDFAIFKTALDSVQITNLVSGTSPVDIVEAPNQAPVATDSSLVVSENSIAGTTVGTVTASDPGDILSYAITAGNGGGEFAIDSNSGVITTTTAFDYEAAASYALTVTVTDSGSLTDTAVVTVNVTNVNEAPVANNSSGSIAEDAGIGATVATVISTDPDAGDSATYSITAGNVGSAFAINSTSGEITTAAALDFETTPSYVLTVTASDNGGLTDTASVNITVDDVVEVTPPSVSTGIARNVTQTSADIDFSVTNDGGEVPVLTLYYGLTNGGVNAASWSNSMSLGAQGLGSYSAPLSGLSPGLTYYYTVHASNSAGEAWGSSSSFTTEADTSPKLVRTTVNAVSSNSWTTVNLGQNYNSAVIIATPIYPDSSGIPVVTRIRNVTSNSFEVKVDAADGTSNVATVDVSIIAVEEGVYTQANDGVTMEAVKYTSSVTSYKNGWTAEARSYQNSYTSPVVVGQVMSANDAEWSTFWCQGSSRTSPPSATSLNVGKHVGEDSLKTRADETIGYIVIESGNGTINGIAYSAGLGSDTVLGTGNTSTGYSYSLSGLSSASAAAVSIAGMDGGDGGWAVLYGSNPLSSTQLTIAVDEDQFANSERNHTTEQCGYIVFE